MAGAGTDSAGDDAGAGVEVLTSSTPRTGTYPRAMMYLAQQRGFPIGDDGRYLDVHPVDQRVALKLSIVAGTLGSNPEMGNRIRAVRPGTNTTIAEASDAVRVALAAEIAAGEIGILSILVESTGSAVFVAVTYVNLITQQEAAARAAIGA